MRDWMNEFFEVAALVVGVMLMILGVTVGGWYIFEVRPTQHYDYVVITPVHPEGLRYDGLTPYRYGAISCWNDADAKVTYGPGGWLSYYKVAEDE